MLKQPDGARDIRCVNTECQSTQLHCRVDAPLVKANPMIAIQSPTCPKCSSPKFKKSGRNRNGSQRYRCSNPDCKTYFSNEHVNTNPLGSMRIDVDKAMMVIGALLEGVSIRGASRLFNVDRDTIGRLILEAGERCQNYMDTNIVNAPVDSIQLDELWSKIYSSDRVKKIKGTDADDEHGSSWTYVCLTDKNSQSTT